MHVFTEPVFWRLRFQCIKSVSQFSGVCGLRGLNNLHVYSIHTPPGFQMVEHQYLLFVAIKQPVFKETNLEDHF